MKNIKELVLRHTYSSRKEYVCLNLIIHIESGTKRNVRFSILNYINTGLITKSTIALVTCKKVPKIGIVTITIKIGITNKL